MKRLIIIYENTLIRKDFISEEELKQAQTGEILVIDTVESTFLVEGKTWQKIPEK